MTWLDDARRVSLSEVAQRVGIMVESGVADAKGRAVDVVRGQWMTGNRIGSESGGGHE